MILISTLKLAKIGKRSWFLLEKSVKCLKCFRIIYKEYFEFRLKMSEYDPFPVNREKQRTANYKLRK